MNKSLVVVPTYNESENIVDIINKVFSLPLELSLLIVDDNSPDGTAGLVEALQSTYPRLHILKRPGKSGLGTAYIAGFNWAIERGFEFIFEMDADFSHNPDDLIKLHDGCANQGYDVTIGSRYIKGVNVVNWPMSRVLMSYFASKYVNLITGLPVKDSTAGFICYRAKVLQNLKLDSIQFVGYAFQIEMKFKAWKYGFKILEVPIVFTDRTKGASKMSSKIFKEAVWGVIKLKIDSFFQKFVQTV